MGLKTLDLGPYTVALGPFRSSSILVSDEYFARNAVSVKGTWVSVISIQSAQFEFRPTSFAGVRARPSLLDREVPLASNRARWRDESRPSLRAVLWSWLSLLSRIP